MKPKPKDPKARSPKWPSTRRKHLKAHPVCEYCKHTTDLEVHHIVPFHLAPQQELDPTNLITLCEDEDHHCHLKIGHKGSWKKFNPNVREDCLKHKNLS